MPTTVPPGADAEPSFWSIELPADVGAPARARTWVEGCLDEADVPRAQRPALRRVATELAREATMRAHPGDTLRLELDVAGPMARIAAVGPSATQRLGARTVDALQSAFEWGFERASGGARRVWCHLDLQAAMAGA